MQDPSRPVTGYPAPGYPQPNGGNPHPPSSGTAYPYQAPPPSHQNYYYSNYNQYPNANANANANAYRYYTNRPLIRTLLATIVGIIIIISVILFIVWIVLRPRFPEFRVDSFSVTNLTTSSQSISGLWQVGLVVFNANKKMTVSYDIVRPSIFYKSEYLTETSVAPFKQGKREETTLNVTFSLVNSYVDVWVANDINGDKVRGSVGFDVKVLANVWFKAGGWRTRNRLLRVSCPGVSAGISGNSTSGKLVGGARKCSVW